MNVAVVGTGNVGSALLFHIVDVPSIDMIQVMNLTHEWSTAAIMDVVSAKPWAGPRLTAAAFDQLDEVDVIVLTSGAQMKKGQGGKDVLNNNIEVTRNILDSRKLKQDVTIIALATPVDDITVFIQRQYRLPVERVLGFGGDLDLNRLSYVLQSQSLPNTGIGIIGEHGQRMIPVYPEEKDFEQVAHKVRNFLGEITACGGSPRNLATGLLIARLVDSIVNDKNDVHYVCGFHPQHQLYLTWPYLIGRHGVAAPQPVSLPPKAQSALDALLARKREELSAFD